MISSVVLFLILSGIIFISGFYKIEKVNRFYLLGFFTLKVIVSFFIASYFINHVGEESDLFQFYITSEKINNTLPWFDQIKLLFGIPLSDQSLIELKQSGYWYKLYDYGLVNDNRIMIRIHLLIHWFSTSLMNHTLIFVFIGFNAIFFFTKILNSYNFRFVFLTSAILFLIPSSLIFTSSLFKETITLFVLGGLSYCSFKILNGSSLIRHLLVNILFLILLIQIKPIYSVPFLIMVIVIYLIHFLKYKVTLSRFILFYLSPLILIIAFTALFQNEVKHKDVQHGKRFNSLVILAEIQEGFLYDVALKKPETAIQATKLDGSLKTVIQAIPMAVSNMIIPFFTFSIKKWEVIPFTMERILLVILLLLGFYARLKEHTFMNDYFAIVGLISIFILVLITLLTPILGLIIKYASPAIILLFLFLTSRVDWQKIILRKTES